MADDLVASATVTEEVLDRRSLEAAVLSDVDGAVVLFVGVIRNHDHGAAVSALDYQAHPEAERFLREVCTELAAESGLRLAAAHRVGRLEIGDDALVVAVAAPHRAEAFATCSRLVDEIKARVPIWKRQHLVDGVSEWIGLPPQNDN